MWNSFGHCAQYGRKPNSTCDETTQELYTEEAQKARAVANFWRSPIRSQYLKGNSFLPVLNNEDAASQSSQQQRKVNFLSTERFSFLASPADEALVPWQTAVFGFFAENSTTSTTIMKEEYIYVHDTFGLKTAYESSNRLNLIVVPNIRHHQWYQDVQTVKEHVLPLLFDQ